MWVSLKPGKVVVVLNGRQAGKKAVIVQSFEEGSKSRKFAHVLVAGIERYPRKITKSMTKKQILKRTNIKPFVKCINLQHVMPTRYSVDIDLKNVVNSADMKNKDKLIESKKNLKKIFQEKHLGGAKSGSGNEWFFQKLRF